MVRVKRGTTAHKRRKKVLKETKGYRWGRKSKYKAAKEAFLHAQTHAYTDRKKKKRTNRRLWQTIINSFCRKNGMTYSNFFHRLKEKKIGLNRKALSQITKEHPELMEKIVEKAKE
jgi:large subunit ribosomal protein L20